MTVSNTTRKTSLLECNGVIKTFDFPFKIFNSSEVTVYLVNKTSLEIEDTLELTTDYTVSFDTEGGTITTVSAYAADYYILIVRNTARTQATSYPISSKIPEKTFENSLDKLTMMIQEMSEQLDRTLTTPITSTLTDLEIPDPVAGKAIIGNEAGDGYTTSTYDVDTVAAEVGGFKDDAETASAAAISAQADAESARDLAETYRDEAQAAVGGVKVSTSDTMAGVLEDKFISGTNVTLSKGNAGGNETLTISATTQVPSGLIAMWSGSIATIPSGWHLCDGNNGTPNLVDRFIVGAKQDDSGVAKTNVTGSLTQSGNGSMPAHSHDAGTLGADSGGGHTHDYRTGYTGGDVTGALGGTNMNPTLTGVTETGGAHTHTISGATATSGTGTTNIAVYYALAFIMKS